MAGRESDYFGAPVIKEWGGGYHQRMDLLLLYGSKSSLKVIFAAGIHDMKLAAQCARHGFQFSDLKLGDRVIWICKQPNDGGSGNQLQQEPQRSATVSWATSVTPVTLPPGRLRLSTSPNITGSLPMTKTIGMVEVAALAARIVGVPAVATMTDTRRSTRPAANIGSLS